MFLEPIWKRFSVDINLLLLSANPKVTGSISPDVLGKVTHGITPCTMSLIIQAHKQRQNVFVHSS